MKRSTLEVASVTIFVLFCGFLCPASVNSWDDLSSAALQNASPGPDTGLIRHDEGFDRETCEIRCRSIYGIPPYVEEQQAGGGGGMGSGYGRYLIIARCIEQCNKRFWKEFDHKMRELDQPVRQ